MQNRLLSLFAVGLLFLGLVACENGSAKGKAAITSSAQTTPWQTKMHEDFSQNNPDWQAHAGEWSLANGVVTQTSVSDHYPLLLNHAQKYSDLDISVDFRPLTGRIDASGGLVFRALDQHNYYVVRANSLEGNYRLYVVKNGVRKQIASVNVKAPSIGQFHSLRVVAVGPHIQAYLDGELLLDYQDSSYSSGFIGLWTKADAVTEFDNVKLLGIPSD